MPNDDTVLQHYVEQIVAVGKPLGIVFFGSQARGGATEDSDWDLLIVDPDADAQGHRAIQYRRALRPRLVPVDLVVATPDELSEQYLRRVPVVVDILQEGRWLYGSPRRARLDHLSA